MPGQESLEHQRVEERRPSAGMDPRDAEEDVHRLQVALLGHCFAQACQVGACLRLCHPVLRANPNAGFDAQRRPLVEDLRRFLSERGLPAIVVYIPAREDLLGAGEDPPAFLAEVRAFADELGASFVDGRDAFAELDDEAIRRHWFPHDGHWNQAGSDRFAGFMFDGLRS